MRFLIASVCVLFASALAGAKAQLKNMLQTIGFYDIICMCTLFALNTLLRQTFKKAYKKMAKYKKKQPAKNTQKEAPQSTILGGQKGTKNRSRRPPGAPWTAPARNLRAKNFPKALLESTLKGIEI